MFRVVLYALILFLLFRALSRLWGGIVIGLSGGESSRGARVPQRGVQMARDPVCGMFIVPGRSVTLGQGRDILHFCSTACRDRYVVDGSRRTGTPSGRTA